MAKKNLPVLESVARDVVYDDGVFIFVAPFGPSLVTIKSSDKDAFNAALEKLGYKPVRLTKNLMNQKARHLVIDADTPLCCDVGSETYWSM